MQLLETIQVKDGEFQNIEFHNKRYNSSRFDLFRIKENYQLENLIKVPTECSNGIFRCRVIYEEVIQEVAFIPYISKKIKTFKLIDVNNWDYSYKYADRSFMNNLLTENKEFDEVIMTKNGFITDCTIANLAFWDGLNWCTPSTPLLNGTKRQQLLEKQEIIERDIQIKDLEKYKGVCLINVFRELSKVEFLTVKTIIQ